ATIKAIADCHAQCCFGRASRLSSLMPRLYRERGGRCTNSGLSRLPQPAYELLRRRGRMAAAVLSAMQDAKFWRIVAVVVCVGLFYVGHGLHDRGGDGLPSLAHVAHAGGV